jgi:hypothetical protein
MERLYTASKDMVEVVAVCDTYKGNLARAKDRVQTMDGNTPMTYGERFRHPSDDWRIHQGLLNLGGIEDAHTGQYDMTAAQGAKRSTRRCPLC